jgi:hypothetical protein
MKQRVLAALTLLFAFAGIALQAQGFPAYRATVMMWA